MNLTEKDMHILQAIWNESGSTTFHISRVVWSEIISQREVSQRLYELEKVGYVRVESGINWFITDKGKQAFMDYVKPK